MMRGSRKSTNADTKHRMDPVMDLERGTAAIPHSFKECHTDIKVVWHYAPLKIFIEHYCYS